MAAEAPVTWAHPELLSLLLLVPLVLIGAVFAWRRRTAALARIAAVEALSAGLVPILSGIAPYKKLLASAPDGVEINAGDSRTAAEAIRRRYAGMSDDVTDLKARLRAVAAPYDWRSVAKRYSDAYRFPDAERVSA
jgi:glycosyltransferase involved in cell wall biosynthesis